MASLISSWASQVNTVPERYVVPSEKRLNINVPIGKDIPVIDFSLPSEKIVEDIIKASQEYGVFQELGGLHVRRQKDGQWFAVEPIPGALVCINGMLLKVISNGKLESGIHRVATNSVGDRISVGCLTSPACNGECIIKPAKALLSETNPPKYKPFSCTEYLKIFFTDTSEFEAALNPYKL
ncbi:hypothetical protein P3S68_013088 [Capsicum galapagoense]